jgi:nicotinate dehydrogenase subunit A
VSGGDGADQSVETVEALSSEPAGRRVVAALLDRNAGQCGYCLPGVVVTLTHLARTRPTPQPPDARSEIARVLDAHLCRCGSQPRIIAAALEALGCTG